MYSIYNYCTSIYNHKLSMSDKTEESQNDDFDYSLLYPSMMKEIDIDKCDVTTNEDGTLSITPKKEEYTPLKFWFNKIESTQTIDDFILTQPNGKEILDKWDHYSEITDVNILSKLKDDISEMKYLYRKNIQQIQYYHSLMPDPDIKQINERIEILTRCEYNQLIKFDVEEINGYKIPTNEFSVPYDVFLEWKEIWNNNKEMTCEDFNEEFGRVACSDWAKMDKHGDCYGGYWKYPEDSYERENAYDLSYKENRQALYDLPYPKDFILHTVKIGCSNRQESVPYTNLLCEYMKRQIDRMNQPKSLKDLCAKVIIKNKLDYTKLPNDLTETYGFNKLYKIQKIIIPINFETLFSQWKNMKIVSYSATPQ